METEKREEYPMRTVSSELKKEGRFKIVKDKVEVKGVICPYDYLQINEGVCVLPLVKEKVLTLRQYRYPIRLWQRELPGGFIDQGESPEEAAIRELSEETGYTVEKIQSLGYFYPSMGSTNEKIHLFLAFCGEKKEIHREVSEVMELELISVNAFNNEIRNGEFKHGAGLAAWARYSSQMQN